MDYDNKSAFLFHNRSLDFRLFFLKVSDDDEDLLQEPEGESEVCEVCNSELLRLRLIFGDFFTYRCHSLYSEIKGF